MSLAIGTMKDRMVRGELFIANEADLTDDYARAQELAERDRVHGPHD